MAESETSPAIEADDDSTALGQILELLRAERRRVVLDYLERPPEERGGFDDLVDYAAREIHGLGYSPKQRNRIRIALYQNHLPKLDDYGVVAYDRDSGEIHHGPGFARVRDVLDAVHGVAREENLSEDRPRPLTRTLSDLLGR